MYGQGCFLDGQSGCNKIYLHSGAYCDKIIFFIYLKFYRYILQKVLFNHRSMCMDDDPMSCNIHGGTPLNLRG